MKTVNHYLIGERIQLERKKKKLTQAQLAEQANLSTNYIGCIECGSKSGSFNAYFKIVSALGIGFDRILADVFIPEQSKEEAELLKIFHLLNKTHQALVLKILKDIQDACETQ